MLNHRSNAFIGISISLALIALAALFIVYFGDGRWAFGNNFWPMHHAYFGHGGMMGYGPLGLSSLLFWGLLIFAGVLVVAWLVGYSWDKKPQSEPTRIGAMDILKQRYARGEIGREQFIHQREVLEGAGGDTTKQ